MATSLVLAAFAGMKMLKRIGMATTIAAILLGWVFVPGALAAEFTITRTDDPLPGNCSPDDCSLREAVIAGWKATIPSAASAATT